MQVGFGRLGEHFWGFEQQGVVPDVVTMGKPFGNGFPLAAVVCRAEIAASFHNGLEYFNTFGGNPVACAAGLAVLDILEREGLQWRAAAVGARLRRRLQQLADDPSAGRLLGEVRGRPLHRRRARPRPSDARAGDRRDVARVLRLRHTTTS